MNSKSMNTDLKEQISNEINGNIERILKSHNPYFDFCLTLLTIINMLCTINNDKKPMTQVKLEKLAQKLFEKISESTGIHTEDSKENFVKYLFEDMNDIFHISPNTALDNASKVCEKIASKAWPYLVDYEWYLATYEDNKMPNGGILLEHKNNNKESFKSTFVIDEKVLSECVENISKESNKIDSLVL